MDNDHYDDKKDTEQGEQPQENTTYSWVNPKLQNGSQPEGANPWDGQGGQNYWHYEDHTESGSQREEQPMSAQKSDNSGQMPVSGKNRQKKSGKKWGTVIAMAVVFGLIAGSVTYGVYGLANTIHPIQGAEVASAGSEEEPSDASAVQDSSEKVSENGVSADSSSSVKEETESGPILSVEEVTKQSMPSLVTISTMSVQEMQDFFGGTQEYQVEGAGTGVIIGENDEELLIATNNHVIEGAEQLSVGFIDESAISGAVKGTDADTDLAVVSVKKADLPDATISAIRVATIGDSNALKLGEQVVAIGNALGYGQSVTSGYVSGLNRSLELQEGSNTFVSDGLIQTDAAINPGNSGGALLNMRGELVGINEAKSSMSSSGATVDNVGYAIPMKKAEPILENMMSKQTREIVDSGEQGTLGVTLTDVTSEYAQMYHMPEGVCFTSVLKGGPADQAGAKKGDVLTRFDGRNVSSYKTLEQILQYYRAGETVDIVVQRAGGKGYTQKTLTITLGNKDILKQMENQTQPQQSDSDEDRDLFGNLFGGN